MKLSGDFEFKLLLVCAGLAGFAFVLYKAGGVAGSALQAVNPLNNDNVINQEATRLYQAVTGSDGTAGTDLYDVSHPAAAQGAYSNPVNGVAVSLYQRITGSKGTFGTDFYDLIH